MNLINVSRRQEGTRRGRAAAASDLTYPRSSLLFILMSSVGISPAGASSDETANAYARAEQLSILSASQLVVNGNIRHHWIENEDRFWYQRTNVGGGKEFIVVDAATGQSVKAFDQKTIAREISKQTKTRVIDEELPFYTFRYTRTKTAIQFHFNDKLWTCQLRAAACSSATPPVLASDSVSPDGRWAAFVKDRNIWVKSTSGDTSFQLTTDGTEHFGYAGSAGYSTHTVSDLRHPRPTPPQVSWSPDSRYILTHKLDERQVNESFLVQSVPEDGSVRPKLYTYRFAMPGDTNLPMSQPIVLDVLERRKMSIEIAPEICGYYSFIEKRDAWWASSSTIIYYLGWDRFSKFVRLNRADLSTGKVSEMLREASSTTVQVNGGIPMGSRPAIRTLRNGDVIWYSQSDGWGHLYYFGPTGLLRNRITQGEWVVRNIVRVDEESERVYFMASGREVDRDPYEQYLYSIHFDGSGMQLLTPEEGDHGWEPAASLDDPLLTEASEDRFSASGRFFVDTFSRPDRPPVFLLRAADGQLIKRLEEADISKLRAAGYNDPEPFQAVAADGRTAIYGNIYRPTNLDPRKLYPVVDSIYPGPQMIRTEKAFSPSGAGAQSLAALGFIVVTIDGRGTPHRSKAFLDHSYGRLDKASDLDDHIAGIRQIAKRYPYLDLDRVGIEGTSGGGYAAARALLTYPDFYKVGISIAGNHDQRSSYSYWGETWIGPLGAGDYLAGSNLPLAAHLRGNLLLMHGELDDNVSPTLTLKLVDALIKENKDFDLLIIPNASHDVNYTSSYVIRRMWNYLIRNLGSEPRIPRSGE